jgi:lysophospholipase
MIDTRAVGQELQDLQHQITGRIRKSQESVTGAIKAWTHAAQAVRPQIPGLPKAETLAARLPKPETLAARLPKPETLAARLPKPETLVTGAYDLAEQFVADQRKLAGQIVHAARPLARQGAAMLGYGAALPGHSTAGTSRPDGSARTHSVRTQPAKAQSAKTVPARTATAEAKPAKARSAKATPAKATPAKATPAKAAAAQKGSAAKGTRSAKK